MKTISLYNFNSFVSNLFRQAVGTSALGGAINAFTTMVARPAVNAAVKPALKTAERVMSNPISAAIVTYPIVDALGGHLGRVMFDLEPEAKGAHKERMEKYNQFV